MKKKHKYKGEEVENGEKSGMGQKYPILGKYSVLTPDFFFRMFGGSTTSSASLGGSQSPFSGLVPPGSGLVPPLPAPALPAVPPPRQNPQTLAASNPIEQVSLVLSRIVPDILLAG